MKLLIVEDEDLAVKSLLKIIQEQEIIVFDEIVHLDSVKSSIEYLSHSKPDFLFLDIHLGDGSSFEILDSLHLEIPVVFITAYEEYALKAHQYHCLGYITKPFDSKEIYKLFSKLNKFIERKKETTLQKRFLVSEGEKFLTIRDEDISYFYAEGKYLFIYTFEGKNYLYESNLAKIYEVVDKHIFFKINRNICININAIVELVKYSNQRLKILSNPELPNEESKIVGRNSVKEIKDWLNQ